MSDTQPTELKTHLPPAALVAAARVSGMPAYQALAQCLFTGDANVRNVKAFFSVKRAKFEPKMAISSARRA